MTDSSSSLWQRVARAYRATALMVFNSLLLLVGLTLVTWGWYAQTESPQRVYSSRLNPDSYALTPPEELSALFDEYDRFYSEGQWKAHPWTGLITRRFEGRLFTVGEDGFRGQPPPRPGDPGRSPLVIWVFGGSTLFGWGVADRHTITAYLQRFLERALPERRVVVRNFAVPYFNSSHELAIFQDRLRQESAPPDWALFLDGYNDYWHRAQWGEESSLLRPLSDLWEMHLRDLGAESWFRVSPGFPLLKLARQIRAALPFPPAEAGKGANPAAASSQDPSVAEQKKQEEGLAWAVRDLELNRRMIRAIAKEMKIEPLFFLQPIPKWDAPEGISHPGYARFHRETMARSGGSVIDLTGLFRSQGRDRQPTVDGVHYSDWAGAVVARAMGEVIFERMDR